jgi:UDP-xylose:glucoside alpha-1,3-xylosyltransferase
LKTIDSILYVDTDVLFISDISDVWDHFKKFNSSQLAALAPEHEEPTMGWYNRFATHPYYGKLGLNSGVMLMNLTRMREFKFVEKILPLYKQYKNHIPWGDQCLLNILFHFHPDKLYVYDCEWNYRPDHCMYGSNCRTAEVKGVRVLHGCRRCFHNDKEPAFKAVYQVIDWYEFQENEGKILFRKLKKMFENKVVSETYCGKAYMNIFKTIKKSFELHEALFKQFRMSE